jgi:hypothetical protein
MTSKQPTATAPAVFEVLWACPFCADNAYFMLDLHPRTFEVIGFCKVPALTCTTPACRRFIPKDIEQSMIDRLAYEPAGGSA